VILPQDILLKKWENGETESEETCGVGDREAVCLRKKTPEMANSTSDEKYLVD
jgi:hypothetical protein